MKKIVFALACALLFASPVYAQNATYVQGPGIAGTSAGGVLTVQGASGGTPIPVSGTFSATLAGFTPNGNYATLAVTTASSNVLLPTGGTVIQVSNNGTSTAYVNLGTSNAVTATTSSIAIPAGATTGLTIGSNTYLAGITASGTAALNIAAGSGLVSGFGAGSGGGGGGGAVFGPTAVGSAAANPPVLVAGTANAAATGTVQVAKVDSSGEVSITAAALPLPAGAATSANQSAGTAASPSTVVESVLDTPSAAAAASPTTCVGQTVSTLQCGSAASHNLYALYATTTADSWIMVFNTTTTPTNGATTAGTASGNLQECVKVPSGTSGGLGELVLPENFTVGVYIAVSSTSCATLTLATTAYLHGLVK